MHPRELELIRPLGEGGFGAVWLAKLHGRDGFHRRVAVKLMKEGNVQPDIIARQRDEARLLGLLQHPHIVAVYDLTEHNGLPAVVMEYVEGVDLSTLVKLTGAVPLQAAVEMAAAVATALDAGWNALAPDGGRPLRVIHRAIKPANVLLTVHGVVKVLDFGVARADFDREAHTQSMAFGTPRFMAPEQFLGGELGAGNDVYALGVTLWEAVMGATWERPALVEERFNEKVARQVGAAPEPVRALLLSMLSWDPVWRPSAREVATALDDVRSEGESLRAYALRVVPGALAIHSAALVERSSSRGSSAPAVSLPTPDSAAADSGPSLAAPAPVPLRSPSRGPPLALLAAAAAAALAGLVLLGVGGTLLAFRARTGAAPEAEPASVAVRSLDAAVEPAAGMEPTAAVEGAAVVEPPPGPEASRPAPRPKASTSGAELVAGLETSRPPALKPTLREPAEPVATPSAPAAPAVAAAPARTRELRIITDVIGARVRIDGIPVGTTPLVGRSFSYGSHRVEIEGAGIWMARSIDVDANTPSTLRYRAKENSWVWE